MDQKSDPVVTSAANRWPPWVHRLWRGLKRALPFALVAVSAFTGVFLYNRLFPPPTPPDPSEINAQIAEVMASATPPPPYSAEVYRTILPSLVLIESERAVADEGADGRGIGSGVIVNDQADILTAYHVVADASHIEVVFADGTRATAEVVAEQPEIDIAVLHPSRPPEIIVPAVLGSPRAMRIGDEAYVVGNPLGLTASMSAGVISGFDRSTRVQTGQRLDGLIQFDTAVNPGSSGGPLLNRQGQIVGIVTGLANPAEQNFFVGIGFAVPIETAVSAAGGPDY